MQSFASSDRSKAVLNMASYEASPFAFQFSLCRNECRRAQALDIEMVKIIKRDLKIAFPRKRVSKGCGVALPHHTPQYSLAFPGPVLEIFGQLPALFPLVAILVGHLVPDGTVPLHTGPR
jgi:hypothetical protein